MKKLNFANILTELRKEKGLTPAQLAEKLGFGKTIIYYWENGKREPNSHALIEISKFFNVPIEYLLGIENEDFKPTYKQNLNTLTIKEQKLLNIQKEMTIRCSILA